MKRGFQTREFFIHYNQLIIIINDISSIILPKFIEIKIMFNKKIQTSLHSIYMTNIACDLDECAFILVAL